MIFSPQKLAEFGPTSLVLVGQSSQAFLKGQHWLTTVPLYERNMQKSKGERMAKELMHRVRYH